MSIFYTMDIQSTIVTCTGDTLAAAKEAATEKVASEVEKGNIAVIDDFGIEIKPGMCMWNVLVKRRNYK